MFVTDIPEHFLQGTGKMLFVRAPKKTTLWSLLHHGFGMRPSNCALGRLHCALGRLHRAVARLHCDQSTDLNLIYMQPRSECGMKSSHGAATEWTSHGARPQISTNLTYCFSKTHLALGSPAHQNVCPLGAHYACPFFCFHFRNDWSSGSSIGKI